MINLFDSKMMCCGCGVCSLICPKNAISIGEDQYGFIYPEINADLCVNCGKCKTICSFQHPIQNISIKESYTAVTKNTDIFNSTSGGAFSSLAKSILEDNGVVYGCELVKEKDRFLAKHISISIIDDLSKLQGSKYIQSDMHDVYTRVKKDLSKKRTVLFCGTPCQVAALKAFLGEEYSSLFTVDLVCHGVPSTRFFNDYISNLERKTHRRVSRFQFRNKKNGWQHRGEIVLSDPNNYSMVVGFSPENSSFYDLYLESYICRDSCYNCPYASDRRPGDITVGDYWGFALEHPELLKSNGGAIVSSEGVSCLVVNNNHGKMLLEKYGYGLRIWESTFEKVSKYNDRLREPITMPNDRDRLFELYNQKGYRMVEKFYQKDICKKTESLYNKIILKVRFLPEKYKLPYKRIKSWIHS